MPKDTLRNDAFEYHRSPTPGKISIKPTKPCLTQRDLALAYSPGVAEPCLAIEENPELADEFTSRANLVGVISNGTAVLGLGNIGALAGKPVMEGKGVLFKRFADIDVFDIELDETDPMKFVETVERMEPTFGGINLEDIKAPECFIIEEELKKRMNIPVLHDDQHGTAVITAAAFINALILQNKKIEDVTIVCLGAGAAGFACMKLIEQLGAKRENIMFLDRKGVITKDRDEELPPHKAYFASERSERTLEEAINGADVFVGLSQGNMVTQEMILSMAANPIVFAMANPDPEIAYDLAMETRQDLIMATGRSDHPNQVNNVLGFPFLFRGALDARATAFNEEMKMAAVYALAELAREDVPASVLKAYGVKELRFGPEYILPKPFDPRLIEVVPVAVAKAATETDVARKPMLDADSYAQSLAGRIDSSRLFMRNIMDKARANPLRMVLPEGEDETVVRAAIEMKEMGIATPILIGRKDRVDALCKYAQFELDDIEVIDPLDENSRFSSLADAYYFDRKRHGVLREDAVKTLRGDVNILGAMLVRQGFADGMLSGRTAHYPNVLRPLLQILGHNASGKHHHVFGMYMMIMENAAYFLADCTVNVEMNADELARLAELAASTASSLGVEPRVGMLSFSNFGSAEHPETRKVADATELLHERLPDLIVDGEMQADTAVNDVILKQYPFSKLKEPANVLIFPTMQAGNISYKLLRELGGGTAIGPVLLGLPHQAHVLHTGASVDDIVNMAAIAAARAADE
ncbi:malate dehydrogenase (oxaloacetate-decarboxylating)(NADP+) [Mariprofundus micogutta]|uniref:Malate dehydrogenase (Oxaloacetate-decarboxylating)(NADP+) n=1 Tax=Mariprofundus micogutta TaxID=1921010 RepID=A0A1L8CM64_9PROT|nr:NADP-dependent malic enzyme [Mariprofundus micogutta]GAV19996.1 malate dehydrogenase (oxaloacetate-decarboxylating)(NADP+) [Mariprofundus micogutta]